MWTVQVEAGKLWYRQPQQRHDVDLQELVPRLQRLVVLQLRLVRVATPAGA